MPEYLHAVLDILKGIKPFDKQQAHDAVMQYIQDNNLNMGQVLNSLRLAIVGAARGPELFSLIEVLGVEEVVARPERAIRVIVEAI